MLNMLKKKREELKKNNKGFTLTELLVVIAIIGFLVAMLAPRYMNYTDKAMGTAAASDVKNIMTIAQARIMDTNVVPDVAALEKAMNVKFGSEKALKLTGADAGKYTYTYSKNAVIIEALIDAQEGTASIDITGATGTSAEKLKRVARGVGSGIEVKVGGVLFTEWTESTKAPTP